MSKSASTRKLRRHVARRGYDLHQLPVRQTHDVASFRRILDHERARTDRSGLSFTVIAFQTREQDESNREVLRMINYLERRLRTIDEVGWMSEDRLAVLLPYTSVAGAWKVADDVIAGGPPDLAPPHCEVFEYPSNWPAKEPVEPAPSDEITESRSSTRQLEPYFQTRLPWWKRLIDIAGAICGLCFLTPLFLIVACLIKIKSPGPILFAQSRTGLGGRKFRMFKFRSMVTNAESQRDNLLALNEQDGPAFKIKNDPRVTPLGRWLRKTSIDELPQLWNVLVGDMTFVGPRPLPCKEMEGCEPWQRRRLDVTPGLTCIWQVRGRSNVRFDEWCRMDMEYIRERSMWTDFKLFVLTLPAVLFKHTGR